MERYKEERRSMLRAKYKVEDYVTRKVSVEEDEKPAAPDAADVPVPVVEKLQPPEPKKEEKVVAKKSKSPSPRPAARKTSAATTPGKQQQQQQHKQQVPLRRMPVESPAVRKWSAPTARNKASTPSPEAGKRATPPRKTSEPPSTTVTRSRLASNPDKKDSTPNKQRSPRLNRKSAPPAHSKKNASSNEDEVNVKERAAMFGGGKAKEEVSRVRTVSSSSSAPAVKSSNGRKKSPAAVAASPRPGLNLSKNGKSAAAANNPKDPGSPSKIKNMAAMFEQQKN